MAKLSDKEREETLARMKAREEKDRMDEIHFQEKQYPELSLPEKQKFWLRKLWLTIRTQGESTNDEFSGFSIDIYKEWKKNEPAIDQILDVAITEIDNMYFSNGLIAKQINARLGRK